MKFVPTIFAARQFVNHGHVKINGKRVTIPSYSVKDGDEIILSTDKGSIMRCAVKEIRIAGRDTQGDRIKKLSGNEKVVSVIKIEDNIQ